MTSLPSPLPGSDSPIPGSSQQNVLVNNSNAGVGATVAQNNVYRPQGPQGKFIFSNVYKALNNCLVDCFYTNLLLQFRFSTYWAFVYHYYFVFQE